VFWFTLVTFNIDDYRDEYTLSGKMDCTELGTCYRTHVDYGLGNSMVWKDDIVPRNAIWYNLLYFFLVKTILMAVISAIIIDTFRAMRTSN